MKTKNIFKAMALAMLMPAMLLTTACSSDDNTAIDNEQTIKKGFELPVTVNVTRQGDDEASSSTNRASYNGTSKKLEFSTGDQLFVTGRDKTDVGGAGYYAGTLTWQSGGTFTGTIFTEHGYTGTADELFAATYLSGGYLTADLLPAGDYGYFSITNSGTYYATISPVDTKAFATSKAVAVEQFSFEHAEYSSGFALSPLNAILNFTITGLPASTNVNATLTKSPTSSVSGNVTTDGSGTATFAMAVRGGSYNINELTLTVGGNDITFTGSDVALAKGHIYNITRSAKSAAQAVAGDVGRLVGADGKIYASATLATAAGTTAVAMIGYVGNESDCTHGVAVALDDESNGTIMELSAATTACAGKDAVTGGTWRLPSRKDWQYLFIGCGSSWTYTDSPSGSIDCSGLQTKLNAVGGTVLNNRYLCTEGARVDFTVTSASFGFTSNPWYVRAVLAF